MGLFDFLTQPVASAAGAALSFLGGQSTNQANIDLANANNQWSAQQYATRYQTQVKDLEAAGLNPMLAVSQGAPPAPQAQPVQLQNPYHSAVQTFNEGMRTSGGYQRDVASAGLSASSAKLNDEQVNLVKSNVNKVKAEIDKLKGDTNFADQQDILRQTAWQLRQSGVLAQERGLTEGQQRAVMHETIANLKKDGILKQLDIDAARKLENFGREYKELAPFVQAIISLLRVK